MSPSILLSSATPLPHPPSPTSTSATTSASLPSPECRSPSATSLVGGVNIRGPSMYTAGIIGLMGGFMYAYQCSAGRLMGMFPNEDDVKRHKR